MLKVADLNWLVQGGELYSAFSLQLGFRAYPLSDQKDHLADVNAKIDASLLGKLVNPPN
jgi:hypothetical protein